MSDTPIKVLLSNGVRNFLSGGGQIGLKGQEDATGRLYWIVVARSLDGATFHVLETRNGTPGALSPHLQRITTSPDIFPMPITSASRPSETAPALPGYERNTAYTAEVIPFPGANPDERPMNPGGGGGGVESGLRLRSYGNHICAVLLVSLSYPANTGFHL